MNLLTKPTSIDALDPASILGKEEKIPKLSFSACVFVTPSLRFFRLTFKALPGPNKTYTRSMKTASVGSVVARKGGPFTGRLGYACLNTVLRTQKPPIFCSRTCRLGKDAARLFVLHAFVGSYN
jgi:hypothetical protein